MKTTMKTLAVATLLVVSALSMAQGRGGMRMMRGGGMATLLSRDDVAKEIKLTDDQKSKLEELRNAMGEEMKAKFQNGGGGGDREAMMKEFQEMAKKSEKEALAVLNDSQRTRLKELWIQKDGNRVILNEDIQKELGLSADQKAKIAVLQDNQREAMNEIRQKMQDGSIDRSEMMPLMEKNNKTMTEELGKILTTDQASKLKKMGGVEFKFDEDNGGF